MTSTEYWITFQPIGRRVQAPAGVDLLEIARQAGIDLAAVCGGNGTCGACRVRLVKGKLSEPTTSERAELTPAELVAGVRLACQACILDEAHIEIPPQSLTAPQRMQIEGLEEEISLDPPVYALDLRLPPPGLHDLRSDHTRLNESLLAQGQPALEFPPAVLSEFSEQLRAANWAPRLAVASNGTHPRLVAILAEHTPLLGLAVDIGTTKLAAYLVNLEDGQTLARQGAMNPQIAYGEDVVSRIAYANEHEHGRHTLQHRLVQTLNTLAEELCRQINADRRQIVAAVMVGNTAMHHLLCGLPVRQLGAAPYLAAVSAALDLPAAGLGLDLAPGANVYLPPNIAGYVGADHVAMLLATQAWRAGRTRVALDIGTNTEITLAHNGHLYCCACASGPAFEGAHIQAGMRAAPGAIERVRIEGQSVQIQTINAQPPVGICGSGILDAVAEMLNAGVIDERGVLNKNHARVQREPGGRRSAFVLVPAAQSGTGQDIRITRSDVNEIQLAKGAIRAGVELLLAEAGIPAAAVEDFIVAGAFGTYIHIPSALRVGMFPDLPPERFRQVGNAAGAGAKHLLLSHHKRQEADAIAASEHYVELTAHSDFTNVFVRYMSFERDDEPPSAQKP